MTLGGGYGPTFHTKHTEKQHIPLDKRLRERIAFANEVSDWMEFGTWLIFCKYYGAEFYKDED